MEADGVYTVESCNNEEQIYCQMRREGETGELPYKFV
jgi:hypothetical protein